MEQIIKKYSISVEGNDLDAKTVQKLKSGDKLKLERVNDGEDTYEITVATDSGKILDMLDYCDSVGVAPFIDCEYLTAENATVDKVVLKQGKSRAKDVTTLYFDVNYSYDEQLLQPYAAESGVFGFISADDKIAALAVLNVLDNGQDMVMKQPYLNMYDMEFGLNEKMKSALEEIEFEDDAEHTFYCRVLFDEKFSKCRVSAKISAQDSEMELELTDAEKETALVFVNHLRIFNGDMPVDCIIE